MKKTILLLTLLTSWLSNACPNLAGEYTHLDHPWNGKFIVKQVNCESISIKFMRKVDPSTSYPNGEWEFTTNYKTDGQAYVGMYESKQLALKTTNSFHTAVYTKDGIVITYFTGPTIECSNKYTFNKSAGVCKKEETRLEYNQELKQFVWEQIGFQWWPHGWSDDVFLLSKK